MGLMRRKRVINAIRSGRGSSSESHAGIQKRLWLKSTQRRIRKVINNNSREKALTILNTKLVNEKKLLSIWRAALKGNKVPEGAEEEVDRIMEAVESAKTLNDARFKKIADEILYSKKAACKLYLKAIEELRGIRVLRERKLP